MLQIRRCLRGPRVLFLTIKISIFHFIQAFKRLGRLHFAEIFLRSTMRSVALAACDTAHKIVSGSQLPEGGDLRFSVPEVASDEK
jgi:hypothetical protein